MKIDFVHTYAATPDRVVALLRTQGFLDDVAQHAGAVDHEVQISDESTKLGMKLPVPENLRKFIGATIQINQVFRFQAARADGTVPGTVEVDVPGMPVEVNAQAELVPHGDETKGHYSGDLRVRIPLVGKKVEAQVEPFIRDAFAGLERRATHWLAQPAS